MKTGMVGSGFVGAMAVYARVTGGGTGDVWGDAAGGFLPKAGSRVGRGRTQADRPRRASGRVTYHRREGRRLLPHRQRPGAHHPGDPEHLLHPGIELGRSRGHLLPPPAGRRTRHPGDLPAGIDPGRRRRPARQRRGHSLRPKGHRQPLSRLTRPLPLREWGRGAPRGDLRFFPRSLPQGAAPAQATAACAPPRPPRRR